MNANTRMYIQVCQRAVKHRKLKNTLREIGYIFNYIFTKVRYPTMINSCVTRYMYVIQPEWVKSLIDKIVIIKKKYKYCVKFK